MNNNSHLKIGLGGIINYELMTFDFCSGERLSPYVSKIIDRDSVYKFKREFVNATRTTYAKKFYENKLMVAFTYKLEKFEIYEYRRFPGMTHGEIEEGYFVILTNEIRELDKDEVIHWIGMAREKEKRLESYTSNNAQSKTDSLTTKQVSENKQLDLFSGPDSYVTEDIDF
jgi:hypothetical protein